MARQAFGGSSGTPIARSWERSERPRTRIHYLATVLNSEPLASVFRKKNMKND